VISTNESGGSHGGRAALLMQRLHEEG